MISKGKIYKNRWEHFIIQVEAPKLSQENRQDFPQIRCQEQPLGLHQRSVKPIMNPAKDWDEGGNRVVNKVTITASSLKSWKL